MNLDEENLKLYNLDGMPSGKKAVLISAVTLFSKNGYNGTSTLQIAELAGVSQATIFKYFKTKQELFLAVIEPLQYSIKSNLIVKNTMKLEEVIKCIIEDTVIFFDKYRELIKIIIQEFMINQNVKNIMQESIIEWRSEIEDYLKNLKKHNPDMNQNISVFDFVRNIYGILVTYLIQSYLIKEILPDNKLNFEMVHKEILLLLRNNI